MAEKNDRLSFHKFSHERHDNLSLSRELCDYDHTTNYKSNIVNNSENLQTLSNRLCDNGSFAGTENVDPSSNRLCQFTTTENVEPSSNRLCQFTSTENLQPSSNRLCQFTTTENVEPSSNRLCQFTTTENVEPSSNRLCQFTTTEGEEPSSNRLCHFASNNSLYMRKNYNQNSSFSHTTPENYESTIDNTKQAQFSPNVFQNLNSKYNFVNELDFSGYKNSFNLDQQNYQDLQNKNQMYDFNNVNQSQNSFDQTYIFDSNATQMESNDQYSHFFKENYNTQLQNTQQAGNSTNINLTTNYKEANSINDMQENDSNFQNTLAQQYLSLNSYMQVNESEDKQENFNNHALLLDNFLYKKSKPFRTIISTLKKKKTKNKCYNCQTDETSLWRKINLYEMQNSNSKQNDQSQNQVATNTSQQNLNMDVTDSSLVKKDIRIVCNACGLYFKMHKRMRPVSMSKGIRKRNRKKDNNTISRHQLFQLKPENTAFQNHGFEQKHEQPQVTNGFNYDFQQNNQLLEFSANHNLDSFSYGYYQGHLLNENIETAQDENFHSNTFTKCNNSIYSQPDYQEFNQPSLSQNLNYSDNQSNDPFNYVFQPFCGRNENISNNCQNIQQMSHKNNQMAHFEMNNQEIYQKTFAENQQTNTFENSQKNNKLDCNYKEPLQDIIETQNLNDPKMPENFSVEAFENECEMNERGKEMHR